MSPIKVLFTNSSVNGTIQCAEIEIVDDRALEGDHNFTVAITATTPPITSGTLPEATVIIVDNDGKLHNYSDILWKCYTNRQHTCPKMQIRLHLLSC